VLLSCHSLTAVQADEAAEGTRNAQSRVGDVHARLQNLRNLLNSERHTAAEQRRAIEALDQEVVYMNHQQQQSTIAHLQSMADARSYGSGPGSERPRPYSPGPVHRQSRPPPPPVPSAINPSNLVRTRRRAFRPSERLTRSQREHLSQSQAQMQSQAASLMPTSSYSTPPSRPSPPLQPDSARDIDVQTMRESRYRAKRRKLDDGGYEDESRAITYGYKGQVVPGQLKMEIISCDGGEYSDPHVSVHSYPQNVLQDDDKVYCTKSNRCNMLLKHSSGMPFTLTKLVLKAPRAGYDAPVEEGMIFIGLNDFNLLEATARYENHYSPQSYRDRPHRMLPQHRQFFPPPPRSPLRSIHRPPSRPETREDYVRWAHYAENDPILYSATVPGFDVTQGDPSDDEDISHSPPRSPPTWHDTDLNHIFPPHRTLDRYRPVYTDDDRLNAYEHSPPTTDSEDGEAMINDLLRSGRAARDDVSDPGLATDDDAPPRSNTRPFSHRRNSSGRLVTTYTHLPAMAPDPPRYERHSPEPVAKPPPDALIDNGSSSDTIAPHARFFIPPHKASVAVRFDPPV
jgi:hypothetical protein